MILLGPVSLLKSNNLTISAPIIKFYTISNLDSITIFRMDGSHNFKQTFGQRQTKFFIINPSRFKIGNNILTNRLTILNNKVFLDDLNLSLNSFKVKYKEILLCE